MTTVTAYDPLDSEILRDPYPILAGLRTATPVFWHEGMASWALTRYADCVAVLRDHENFARDRRRAGEEVPEPSLSVQSLDPPHQAPVRSLFMNGLRAQDLDVVQAHAGVLLDDLWQRHRDGEPFDVLREIAVPLTITVIAELLGVAEPEHSAFAQVSDAIMQSMDGGLDPSVVEPGRLARLELSALVESWFRTGGRAGLLEHVRRHAPADADPALAAYVRNTARVMFQGGYSTMVAAVGNVISVLLRHPAALDRLRDPAVLNSGVDELVRFDGPVQGTSRVAMGDCEVGGVRIAAGQTVTTLFAAANHDPDEFSAPGRLVLDRTPNRHLGFGWGTHSCIGTTAAQAALRALVASLTRCPVPLRAAGEARRRRTATMRVFESLPVAFASAPVRSSHGLTA